MPEGFVHEAVLIMEPGTDIRAPGAAITVELCGHWQHSPPCPVAPHHTLASRAGREVRVRTLFAAEPAVAGTVRQRIDRALSGGHLHGPDGVTTRWQLRTSYASVVLAEEIGDAQRLVRS